MLASFSCSNLDDFRYEKEAAVDAALDAQDFTLPVPGSAGTINFVTFSADSITINWAKATDDYTAQSSLYYLVYYSLINNINTVANVLANGTPVGSFTADITNKTVTGLLNNATYYLNTLVIDANNNTNCYSVRTVTKYVQTTDFNSSTNFIFDTTATGANISKNVTNFPVLQRITDQVLIDSVESGAPISSSWTKTALPG